MEINDTSRYHVNDLQTLGWELTVCNALTPLESPCRKIVAGNRSYGSLLHDFLARYVRFDRIELVVEIGGGYGFVMKEILQRHPGLKATMIDISPHLIGAQERLLRGYNVSCRLEDFLETDTAVFRNAGAVIMNENIGDFPTILDLCPEAILNPEAHAQGGVCSGVQHFFKRYGLGLPTVPSFHVNIGALTAVEKLCSTGIPCIFVSEHSCEAKVPDSFQTYVRVSSPGTPEKIPLKGHDEYTIQFSYLAQIALAHGYSVVRGPIADFIPVEMTDRLRCRLAAPAALTDEDEIFRQFMEDLYQYEYLLLTKDGQGGQCDALYKNRPCPPQETARQ